MKDSIHPNYHPKATISCACGNTATIGSTIQSITVELCNSCHPFYTGTQKLIDTAGRVERFKQRVQKKSVASAARKGKKIKREIVRARKSEV